jgi:hypothetical protein
MVSRFAKGRNPRLFSEWELFVIISQPSFSMLAICLSMVCMLEKTVALAKALDVPMSALFSFNHDEADPKVLKKRIEASLANATSQQLKQIYGHVRQVMES